jgi:hypothetical protein
MSDSSISEHFQGQLVNPDESKNPRFEGIKEALHHFLLEICHRWNEEQKLGSG